MKHYSIIILLLLVVAAGCGSGQVGLKGTVVFDDDGSPLTTGTVIFTTATFQARGNIDGQGTFTMGSFGEKDGLPPGTYQVGITGATVASNPVLDYDLITSKWASPATSGCEITVEKGMKSLEIRVERNPNTKPVKKLL